MKLLTKEDEENHYAQVLRYGTTGGLVGLGTGLAGVFIANRRIPLIRNLTLPMKAFLVTSTGTIGGILAADRGSRQFEFETNASKREFVERENQLREARKSKLSAVDRALEWCKEERYSIVGATWVASMLGSWVLVSRDRYLTGKQKIVQARVYAQGLTLAVLIASAAFEIADQRKAQAKVDQAKKEGKPVQVAEHRDGADMWKDMVEAEEVRIEKREEMKEEEKKKEEEGKAKADREDVPVKTPKRGNGADIWKNMVDAEEARIGKRQGMDQDERQKAEEGVAQGEREHEKRYENKGRETL